MTKIVVPISGYSYDTSTDYVKHRFMVAYAEKKGVVLYPEEITSFEAHDDVADGYTHDCFYRYWTVPPSDERTEVVKNLESDDYECEEKAYEYISQNTFDQPYWCFADDDFVAVLEENDFSMLYRIIELPSDITRYKVSFSSTFGHYVYEIGRSFVIGPDGTTVTMDVSL